MSGKSKVNKFRLKSRFHNLWTRVYLHNSCTLYQSPEAAVYGYGALKFLTMNSALCARLLSRGVLELLTLHMMLIVNEVRRNYLIKCEVRIVGYGMIF